MLQSTGDMFNHEGTAFVITTNGFYTGNRAVMGRGCARQLCTVFPDAPHKLAAVLRKNGNITQIFMDVGLPVIAFPVKPFSVVYDGTNVVSHAAYKYQVGQTVPGFHAKADLNLIAKSAKELVQLVDSIQGTNAHVIMPRPGCGAGELNWRDVEPILQSILDDRFVAVTF